MVLLHSRMKVAHAGFSNRLRRQTGWLMVTGDDTAIAVAHAGFSNGLRRRAFGAIRPQSIILIPAGDCSARCSGGANYLSSAASAPRGCTLLQPIAPRMAAHEILSNYTFFCPVNGFLHVEKRNRHGLNHRNFLMGFSGVLRRHLIRLKVRRRRAG